VTWDPLPFALRLRARMAARGVCPRELGALAGRREVSRLGHVAAAAGRRGDVAAARAALLGALSWLPSPADAASEARDAVLDITRRCLADGHPYGDEELAMVARCSEEAATAARAVVEGERR